MDGTVTLGRIRGIPVRLHVSWFVIFGLIAWSLASGYFPQAHPGSSLGAYWLQGVIAALLLFVSVFVHELSHSVVALRYGIPVSSITLHVFGGVSQMTREPDRPGVEALVAIVGPLTSLVIAAWFALLELLVPAPASVEAVMRYLKFVNGAIGVFNLCPGFPLDGGRLLRAALWKAKGDRVSATRRANKAGQAFAAFLIVVGILRTLGGEFFGGLWLLLIGFFLRQAAAGSAGELTLQRALEPFTVKDAMTPNPIALPHRLTVGEAVDGFFWSHHVSSFPVLDGDRVVGIVSLDRLKSVPRGQWTSTRVEDIMLPIGESLIAAPRDPLWSAFHKLAQNGLGRLAVVDGSQLVGYLSLKDVTHVLGLATLRP